MVLKEWVQKNYAWILIILITIVILLALIIGVMAQQPQTTITITEIPAQIIHMEPIP